MKLKNRIYNIYKKTGINIDCEIDISKNCNDLDGWFDSSHDNELPLR